MILKDDVPWVTKLLVCPDCRRDFTPTAAAAGTSAGLECRSCGIRMDHPLDEVVPDLRSRRPRRHELTFTTGATDFERAWHQVGRTPPPVTYPGPERPRTSNRFLSVIRDAVASGSLVVDIGCGSVPYKDLVRNMGRRYLGLDYGNPAADALADAHSLPLRDRCADVILMYAASQAFENPFVAVAEAARVLKPGGLFLGTADSGAVFVASFFHITPYGVLSVLLSQGLTMERAWRSKDALMYFATNPGYPRIIRAVLRPLSRLAQLRFLSPRNWVRGAPEDPFVTAGSFAFIARKTTGEPPKQL